MTSNKNLDRSKYNMEQQTLCENWCLYVTSIQKCNKHTSTSETSNYRYVTTKLEKKNLKCSFSSSTCIYYANYVNYDMSVYNVTEQNQNIRTLCKYFAK